ncbi:MAG: 4Fe-4S dicluster domain-containing protein [Dehalococcoidia bacterium]|nr:4Fe-4S dicluster domain-containing protein [Dehalococcoidia bacterium]
MGLIDLLLKPLVRSRSTVGYPKMPADSVRTRRVPRFEPAACTDNRKCEAACPTGAITIAPGARGERRWALDYGKCIFCAECIRVCPSGAISGTGDYALAAPKRAGVVAEYLLGSQPHD